jgi:hypothetical protein
MHLYGELGGGELEMQPGHVPGAAASVFAGEVDGDEVEALAS